MSRSTCRHSLSEQIPRWPRSPQYTPSWIYPPRSRSSTSQWATIGRHRRSAARRIRPVLHPRRRAARRVRRPKSTPRPSSTKAHAHRSFRDRAFHLRHRGVAADDLHLPLQRLRRDLGRGIEVRRIDRRIPTAAAAGDDLHLRKSTTARGGRPRGHGRRAFRDDEQSGRPPRAAAAVPVARSPRRVRAWTASTSRRPDDGPVPGQIGPSGRPVGASWLQAQKIGQPKQLPNETKCPDPRMKPRPIVLLPGNPRRKCRGCNSRILGRYNWAQKVGLFAGHAKLFRKFFNSRHPFPP